MNTESPPPKRPFSNPYDEFNGCAENQLQCYVSTADKELLRMIRTGASGTFSTTLALLVKQLCHELRTKQITEPQHRDTFESFLTNMRIVDATEYDCLLVEAAQRVERDFATRNWSEKPSSELRDSTIGRSLGHSSGPNDSRPVESQDNGMATGSVERVDVESKVKRRKASVKSKKQAGQ